MTNDDWRTMIRMLENLGLTVVSLQPADRTITVQISEV